MGFFYGVLWRFRGISQGLYGIFFCLQGFSVVPWGFTGFYGVCGLALVLWLFHWYGGLGLRVCLGFGGLGL